MEEQAHLSQAYQAETHEKAVKQGQPQHSSQGSLPRYSEPGTRTITANLSPGASSSSSTAHTSDAPQSTIEPLGAYRLQLEQWLESADDIPMDYRQMVETTIEKYLDSPEENAWTLNLSGFDLTTVPPPAIRPQKTLPPKQRTECIAEALASGLART